MCKEEYNLKKKSVGKVTGYNNIGILYQNNTILNPFASQIVKLDKDLEIRQIDEFLYTFFSKWTIVFFCFIYFIIFPQAMYDHLNNIDSIFTISSAEHKIGYSIFYFFYLIAYYFVAIFFLNISSYAIKKLRLSNKNFDNIDFSQIRKIVVKNKLFVNKVSIYKTNTEKPISYLFVKNDDCIMLEDIFQSYLIELQISQQTEKKEIPQR